jgi:hypothetical protein
MPPPQDASIGDGLGKAPGLMALINAGTMTQAICVAAELRIPDLLANGPKDARELAQATGSHAPSLHRLLRALASLDLCEERDDGAFALGAMGTLLRSDTPTSLRSWTIWCTSYMWPVWGNLRHSVRTGESSQKLTTGIDGFEQLERDPVTAAAFNDAMVDLTRLIANEVVRTYDFSGTDRIVDIGGGEGALVAVVLKTHSGMRGVVFDRPHAIEGAKTYLANEGLAERCDLIAGDFFESVPGAADTYLLKNIIHDWNDERSAIILCNCRKAIPEHGRLLLLEQIMPSRLQASSPHRAVAWADLTMLLGPGGFQRTETAFGALLASSGFRLARTIETSLGYSIIECVPR